MNVERSWSAAIALLSIALAMFFSVVPDAAAASDWGPRSIFAPASAEQSVTVADRPVLARRAAIWRGDSPGFEPDDLPTLVSAGPTLAVPERRARPVQDAAETPFRTEHPRGLALARAPPLG